MAVYGYCRVSTQLQSEEGESLGVQQRQIEGYALQHGMGVDRIFVERAVSGSIPLGQRPEGAELIATLKSGDIVISPRLDRCFRSALDALTVLSDLKQRGVSLHLLDLGGDVLTNGHARMMFTILSAVSEAERERVRERVSDVKRDQKARGRFLGGSVPFGYRLDQQNQLVPVQEEQDAIQTMKSLKSQGQSLRSIADAMTARGFRVSHMTVKAALARTGADPN